MIMGAWGMGRKKGWTNPYVTDGLVAMWDGEWNAGGGVHDANVAPVNLAGNTINLTFEGGYNIGSNHFEFLSGGYAIDGNLQNLSNWSGITIESVQYLPKQAMGLGWLYYDVPYSYSVRFGHQNGNASGNVVALHGKVFDTFVNNTYLKDKLFSATLVIDMSVAGQRTTKFYVNAIEKTPTAPRVDTDFTKNPTAAFVINNASSDNANNRYCSVRVSARPLSADEIAANHAVDKERFSLP